MRKNNKNKNKNEKGRICTYEKEVRMRIITIDYNFESRWSNLQRHVIILLFFYKKHI